MIQSIFIFATLCDTSLAFVATITYIFVVFSIILGPGKHQKKINKRASILNAAFKVNELKKIVNLVN